MSFFRQFPTTTYDFGTLIPNGSLDRLSQSRTLSGVATNIVDLFRNVTVDPTKISSTISYQYYTIQNGDRPDTVSQLLYQDPDYYWTFFIINNRLKTGLSSWPMSHGQMESYLEQEYDSYSTSILTQEVIITGLGYLTSTGQSVFPDPNDSTWYLTPKEISNGVNLLPGQSYITSNAHPNNLNFMGGIDLINSNIRVQDSTSGALIEISMYDSNMNQLWLNKGTIGGIALFSLGGDSTSPFTLIPNAVISQNSGQGQTGVGGEVEPILSSLGIITGFRLLNGGAGYVSIPDGGAPIAITIDETPSIPATIGSAVITSGSITGITLSTFGLGYKRLPLIYVNGTKVTPTGMSLTSTGVITGGTTFTITPSVPSIGANSLTFAPNVISVNVVGQIVSETLLTSMTSFSLVPINPYKTGTENFTTNQSSNNAWLTNYQGWITHNIPSAQYLFPTGVITFSATEVIGSGRNAPQSYQDSNGITVTALDALTGVVAPTFTTTYSDHENNLNIERSKIQIVSPEYIRSFAQQYRSILNE